MELQVCIYSHGRLFRALSFSLRCNYDRAKEPTVTRNAEISWLAKRSRESRSFISARDPSWNKMRTNFICIAALYLFVEQLLRSFLETRPYGFIELAVIILRKISKRRTFLLANIVKCFSRKSSWFPEILNDLSRSHARPKIRHRVITHRAIRSKFAPTWSIYFKRVLEFRKFPKLFPIFATNDAPIDSSCICSALAVRSRVTGRSNIIRYSWSKAIRDGACSNRGSRHAWVTVKRSNIVARPPR